MHGFDVYFTGEIVSGNNPAEVKTRIAKLFGLSDDRLDALFNGESQRIKTNIKADEAAKYHQAFLKSGALAAIVPTGSKPPVPSPASSSLPEPAADNIQLLPANTGSLIDTAKPVAAFDLSSADQLSLSPADMPSQETSIEPSFEWNNIRDIEVLPANTGSLEDCTEKKEATRIPDISGIKLVK